MPLFNKRDQYGWMTVLLHWLLFLIIVGLVASGKYSDSLSSSNKNNSLIFIHTQIGIAVFVLMAFRFLWRLINTTPEPLSEVYFARLLAFLMHWIMYIVVLGQVVVGVCMMQLGGREVAFFGIQLPLIVSQVSDTLAPFLGMLGDDLSPVKQMRKLHELGGWAIIGLVGAHIVVAFFHHFVLVDDTLRRMSFGYLPSYIRHDVKVNKMLQKRKNRL